MSYFFHTAHIALTISVYLAALAVGQLIYGPILDRFGRRPVLIVCLFIYLVGSILTLHTTHFGIFLLARFIQGMGASATLIAAIAAVRDTNTGNALIQSMSKLLAIVGVAPSVAPMLGSVLTQYIDWKANFHALLILGIAYAILIILFFREPQKEKNLNALHIPTISAAITQLLKNKIYLIYSLSATVTYSSFFIFITTGPHLIISDFKFPETTYGLVALTFGLVIFIGSILTPKVAKKLGASITIVIGSIIECSGAAIMLLLSVTIGGNLYTLTLPMLCVVIGFAVIRPLAISIGIKEAPESITATASALFNLTVFIGAAIITALSGFVKDSVFLVALLMLALNVLFFFMTLAGHKACQRKLLE